jgi:hypothetical protein
LSGDPVWVDTITIRAGTYSVTIGVDDGGTASAVRAAYADLLVESSLEAHDFGIQMNAAAESGPRPLPTLIHGLSVVMRSRNEGRLLRRLDGLLAAVAAGPAPGRLELTGMAAITTHDMPRRAVIVPNSLATRSSAIERKISAAGLGLADETCFSVDFAEPAVIVSPGLSGGPIGPGAGTLVAVPESYELSGVVWTEHEVGPEPTRVARLTELVKRSRADGSIPPNEILRRLAVASNLNDLAPLAASGSDISPLVELLNEAR